MKKKMGLILLALALTAVTAFTGCESLGGLFGGGSKDSGKAKAEKEVDERDTSWYKSSESTFYIANDKQLGGLAKLTNQSKNPVDFEGKTVVLTADIDLAGTKWRPIGPFSGTFDGKGFSISNLSISDYANAALFGNVSMATIKNLVVNVDKIETKKTSSTNAGGLIALGTGVTIENCAVIIKDSITAYSDKGNLAYAGGLAGSIDGIPMFNTTINNCYVSGNVSAVSSGTGGPCAGGLVGMVGLSLMRAQVNINNSYMVGNVSAASAEQNSFAGGFIASGGLYGSDIKNSYVNATITSTVENPRGDRNKAFLGGFFGRWCGGTNSSAYYNSAKVSGQNINSGTKDGSLPTDITALSDTDMKKQASFKNFDFTNVWAIDSATNNGYPYLRWQKKQ